MLETVYIVVGWALQVILITYFALRKWRAALAFRVGWAVYALGVPLALYTVGMALAGGRWYLWIGGLLYALWSLLGRSVDIGRPLQWYEPICPYPFNGYVALFLAYEMFFWWPLNGIWRPGWIIFAALFALATTLNVTSRTSPVARAVRST